MSDDNDPDRASRPLGDSSTIWSLPPGPPRSRPALAPPGPIVQEEPGSRTLPADIIRTPRHVYVTLEIPGAARETIDVIATDRELTVHASRPDQPEYNLELSLPVRVDPKSARATYRNGVLDITLARIGRPGPEEGETNVG